MDHLCGHLVTESINSPFWSVITAAPGLSQIIGVLAAVVFTGIIFVMQQAPPSEDSDTYRFSSRALMMLLFVFLSLVMASFFYGVVGGEENCKRAFAEGAIAGSLFGASVIGMFLSICWLFAAQRIGGPYVIWAKILTFMATGVAWIFVVLTLLDATQVIESTPQGITKSGIEFWGDGTGILPIATLITLWIAPSLRKRVLAHSAGLFNLTLGCLICSAVVALTAFSAISIQPEQLSFPLQWRVAAGIILAVDMTLYLCNMMVIRRAPPPILPAGDSKSGNPDAGMEAPFISVTINLRRRKS